MPATVAIAPDSVTMRWGASLRLTAAVRDSSGALMSDVPVIWGSSLPNQVQVTSDGVIRAVQPGIVTITARARDVTGSARVVVFIPAATVALTLSEYGLVPGTTRPLTTTWTDSLGRALFNRPRMWVSTDTTVFVVDSAGVLTGRANGLARVIVTSDDVADTADVRVVPARLVTIRPGMGPHTCALADDGRAFCWGGNDQGQLGNGDATSSLGPTLVAGGHHFDDIGGGGNFHCAREIGDLYCWGNGARGRLGNGTLAGSLVPGHVLGQHIYRAVAAGWSHSCALAAQFSAVCWGNGDGVSGDADKQSTVPIPIESPDGMEFTHVSSGDGFSCALDHDGVAHCWGRNDAGQLGDSSNASSEVPVRVRGGTSFVTLTSGTGHSCGVTAAGSAWCWGSNSDGQLGDSGTSAATAAVLVAGGHTFRMVSAGMNHSCGVTTDGEVWCWGANNHGQLGDGGTAAAAAPIRAAAALRFADVAVGGGHSCGIDTSGIAWCWGNNQAGQLGDGTRADRPLPVRVAGQP